MIKLPSLLARNYRVLRGATVVLSTCATAALLTGTLHAKPIPSNLGNGLDKLVASNLAIANAKASGIQLDSTVTAANGQKYTDDITAAVATNAISDAQGRVLVRLTLDGSSSAKDVKKSVKSGIASATVTAIDKQYRGVGVMNAYVAVADVPALAKLPGIAAVILEWKPVTRKSIVEQALTATGPNATVGETLNMIGTTFDQGVTQHRVDQINKFYNPSATLDYEGQGMQVACISNSFAANTAGPATADVTSNDLPGGSTNPVNTTPVFVFQDDLSSTTSDDEGRGMCQIAFKMAPKATIGFATADNGEVGFANNIRGLAGLPGYTIAGQTFAADTICDDVGYYDEPYFQDGIISSGIEDASASGVCYFSSAANDIGTNGYDSDTRWLANGTGLDRRRWQHRAGWHEHQSGGGPANLYAGGFHNFNPAGQDVAQTVNIAAANTVPTIFQWNDPYDQTTAATGATQIYSGSGTFTTTAVNFTVTGECHGGHQVRVCGGRHQQQRLRRHCHRVQIRRHHRSRGSAGHRHGRDGAPQRADERQRFRGQDRPLQHHDGQHSR